MKYICTKQEPNPDNDIPPKEIFVFPKHLEFDVIAPLLNVIRNQTWGNWRRIPRPIISAGSITNVSGSFVFSSKQDPELISSVDHDLELFKKQLNNVCKYIVVKGYKDYDETEVEEIYIFPSDINHDCFYEAINNQDEFRKIISGGFVNIDLVCQGHSESLGVKSRSEDTVLLKKEISI